MSLNPGQIIQQRYRVVRRLGQGGFGAIYRAWDMSLSRPCAIKENLDASRQAQEQFSREAVILANLNHPNLARVTDYFFIPDQGQYLVMDFVEGRDLQEMLDTSGEQLSEGQVVDWILQILDALQYLHTQDPPIIHRDIKPANIRITSQGKAMLVDFGIAKVFDPRLKTTAGARAVTPGYSPPEQYGLGTTDARSDLYALGVTLYVLLTRVQPQDSVDLMTGSAPSPAPARQLNPGLSLQMEQTLQRAMQLNRAERFPSAAEFKAALLAHDRPDQEIQATLLVSPAGASLDAAGQVARTSQAAHPPVPSRTPAKRPAWLWPVIAGGAGLAGLAVFAVIAVILYLASNPESPVPKLEATPTPVLGQLALDVTQTSQILAASETPVEPLDTPVSPGRATPVPPTVPPPPPVPTPDPRFMSKDPQTYTHLMLAQPDTLDPAINYEAQGGYLLPNIYDGLVQVQKDNPSQIVPQLGADWAISPDGRTYIFKLQPGVRFHDGSPLSVEDVVYTFQRGLLQGGSGSPQWLLTEPLLGAGIMDVAELVDPALVDQPAELVKADAGKLLAACQRVTQAITADPAANTVIFHLAQPWAPLLVSLSGPWGSIQSKAWVIKNGGWNGDCAAWARYYGKTIDQLNKSDLGGSAMGTGPFVLDHWTPGKELVLKSNVNYWRTAPAWEGAPSGPPRLKTVVINLDSDLAAARKKLQSGEADGVDGLSSSEYAEIDPLVGQVCPPGELQCQPAANDSLPLERISGYDVGERGDIFFTFAMDPNGNSYIGSKKLDGKGVPPEFFSDVHVRRAFSYCFNYQSYLDQALLGEGRRAVTVMLPGMPGYQEDAVHYNFDPARCAQEFQASPLVSASGASLWDTGFTLTIPYNDNSFSRKIVADILQSEITAVNPKFLVKAAAVSNDEYRAAVNAHRAPINLGGWVEDVHDTHYWVAPYTVGLLGQRQNMPPELQNQFRSIINRGLAQTDPQQRAAVYHEFNQLYFDQAPAILLFQREARRYQARWVNGWYPYPPAGATYFYALSKN